MSFIVDGIFYKKINPGDLWNIERPPGIVTGGGGQTYINLAIDDTQLVEFLKYGHTTPKPADHKGRNTIEIVASTLGNPTQTSTITFDPRSGRNDYTIANQHRNRHPAWTSTAGFPSVPTGCRSADDVKGTGITTDLVIVIIRTLDGKYTAGYFNVPSLPSDWKAGIGLENIFSGNTGIRYFKSEVPQAIPMIISEALKSWEYNPNVLLYGPPGTGKTFAMQWLWENIDKPVMDILELDNSNLSNPFKYVGDPLEFFKGNLRKEWLTFHQNFSYEDFIIGKLPVPSPSGGFSLKPKAGILLDVALSVNKDSGAFDKAIIFIDELNRGNVSKIFGQLITFLDSDKRGWDKHGDENPMKIPVPLPELQVRGDKTEEVTMIDGSSQEIPFPHYFPSSIYILASMNSVDRAVAPLDSALARRFEKINCGPDYEYLEELFAIDKVQLETTTSANWNSKDVAYKLLVRVNGYVSKNLGEDFELGQSYITKVSMATSEIEGFNLLANNWEKMILPQLVEKFGNRQDILADFLKINEAIAEATLSPFYPYRYKIVDGVETDSVLKKSLKELGTEELATVLRYLADERH
ncbi:AAA family ATPase [Paenibacillus polymyxa]|uniref:AAA family ATPase n=1 Tax=Paenibacillus polymyxa TaxID=1406 RepID=A0A8I1LW98_PAEPO|nr:MULTISPECIES: AAA family ATPase [Paenibacillus]KAF6575583.1 AAA family ATPase [Paenibacillus sp. EKM206P]KAF6589215.1 AAA family ATPase [Paenibacillus sp. EKM205P]MBM0634587.1 AAA family ATPase [Paenibacillus polymyxa]